MFHSYQNRNKFTKPLILGLRQKSPKFQPIRGQFFGAKISWNENFIMQVQVAYGDANLFHKFFFIIEILDFFIALAPE